MKLLSLKLNTAFRSLPKGFEIKFRKEIDLEKMDTFAPFCFAGLNGSGKSNVLEALANIFYHLELCANRFKPDEFKAFFDPSKNATGPDAFELEYLTRLEKPAIFHTEGIEITSYTGPVFETFYWVKISKKSGEYPEMEAGKYYRRQKEVKEFVKEPIVAESTEKSARGKRYLPDLVVGYSSGENEILSLPFIKTRLIHFDEYIHQIKGNERFKQSESSLVYIDSEMSQAVLLACLIFEDEETLKPLKEELGIEGMRSFRMCLNDHNLYLNPREVKDKNGEKKFEFDQIDTLGHIKHKIDALKKIATSFYEESRDLKDKDSNGFVDFRKQLELKKRQLIHNMPAKSHAVLDFYVDDEMKKAFRSIFDSALDFFRFLELLYELNLSHLNGKVSGNKKSIKTDFYKSPNLHDRLPTPVKGDQVFYFEDFQVQKQIKGTDQIKDLPLRSFSDGEHQFLHTMGICLLLKSSRTLLLLDEPETHFNPDWRSKFIHTLNKSLKSGGSNYIRNDVLLTSHSPFIISDCLPNNVLLFQKNEETGNTEVKNAKQLNFNTYGASIEIILHELFNKAQSIGDQSKSELDDIINNLAKTDIQVAKKELRKFGPSIEKDLILARLNQMS